MEKKMSTPIEMLCKGMPIEFSTYLNYCRSLRFEDKPDYLYLRKMFKELFYRESYEWDYMYDWCMPVNGKSTVTYSNEKISIQINTAPPENKLTTNNVINEEEHDRNKGGNLIVSEYQTLN